MIAAARDWNRCLNRKSSTRFRSGSSTRNDRNGFSLAMTYCRHTSGIGFKCAIGYNGHMTTPTHKPLVFCSAMTAAQVGHPSRPCRALACFFVGDIGYCQYHNPYRPRRFGEVNQKGNNPHGLSDLDVIRFWGLVDKSNPNGCWLWRGQINQDGYGLFQRGGNRFFAHRVAYALLFGELNEMCGCHKCDTPLCVRPNHIFPGTLLDNVEDCRAKGRQPEPFTHCRRGHEFTPENTIRKPEGRKTCRICRNARCRRRRAELKAARAEKGDGE